VDYEWNRLPFILDAYAIDPKGLKILEFGCNVGASAIVFSHLGADVCAIDISEPMVDLARMNSECFSMQNIEFRCVPDTRKLPFPDQQFDLVNCNSVLEYIDTDHLPAIQVGIDRIVRAGGKIMVSGTSSRLWPREVHSKRWLVNYVPRALDRCIPGTLVRGIYPWTVRNGFGPHYINLDAVDKGSAFMKSLLLMGSSSKALRRFTWLANVLGFGPGMLAQNISCVLSKQA
jgi:ubiquinone/menaquinone biosynthesis C-methylase UbiE